MHLRRIPEWSAVHLIVNGYVEAVIKTGDSRYFEGRCRGLRPLTFQEWRVPPFDDCNFHKCQCEVVGLVCQRGNGKGGLSSVHFMTQERCQPLIWVMWCFASFCGVKVRSNQTRLAALPAFLRHQSELWFQFQIRSFGQAPA
jgi:hypothetical protein